MYTHPSFYCLAVVVFLLTLLVLANDLNADRIIIETHGGDFPVYHAERGGMLVQGQGQ